VITPPPAEIMMIFLWAPDRSAKWAISGLAKARIQTPTDRIRLISAGSSPRYFSHAGQNGR
jgi:hypothetical protein